MVEHWSVVPVVEGSIPFTHPFYPCPSKAIRLLEHGFKQTDLI